MAKGKKKTVSVDFTGVQSGGGRFRVPEGDYLFEIEKIETGTTKSSGVSKLVVTLKGVKGRVKNRKAYDHIALQKNTLWKLRSLLEATGQDVPESKAEIDIDALIGEQVGVTLGDDEYEGKISSKPQGGYISPDAVGEEPDEADNEDDDDEPENGAVDFDEMTRKELLKFAKDNDLGITGTKDMTDKKLKKAVVKAYEDDETEMEDVDLDDEL